MNKMKGLRSGEYADHGNRMKTGGGGAGVKSYRE